MNKTICQLFISTVSQEFRSYRDLLARDLQRPNLAVKVQEDFVTTGGHTLGKLDDYIRHCDAVIHLIGRAAGSVPEEPAVAALLDRYPDLPRKIPLLADRLELPQPGFSYTQWEAYLGLYHGRPVFFYSPTDDAPRDPTFAHDPEHERSQEVHYQRIRALGRDRGTFANQERLSTAVLRDLVEMLPGLTGPVRPTPLRGTIPKYDTPFVGQEVELGRIERLIDGGRTLIVLRGGGGIGKTRLACEVASRLEAAGRFPGGCVYAELKGRDLPERVAYVVQIALGRAPRTDRESDREAAPAQAVAELLASLPPTLLVLNNLEPIGKLAEQTVGVWRQAARQVVFLVTSRPRLSGVDEVQDVRLSGLDFPPHPDRSPGWLDRLMGCQSIRLFVETARFGSPDFTLTRENAADVEELCRALQGQPHPIILVARRIRNATPAEVADELRGRLHAVADGGDS
ncbi:MAG TPA: hypothetical protein VH092_31950, partial [Urbifossiella sp.]|nr:hypothetical protein [Urbifossiella sp.]